ncbi:MAG: hypothetical protein ACJ0BK_01445 [Coraliomargaritaceae bacterium]
MARKPDQFGAEGEIAPFVEQVLIPFPATPDDVLGCAQWRRRRDW